MTLNESLHIRELYGFLNDYRENSQTELVEEAKEKDELFKIAKSRGILLKDSRDLVGFKTIYIFADRANNNGARVPKKVLLKILPTLVGKPVDIDHLRNYVVGYYIDFRYIADKDMVIAYGVFFKSNFAEEWKKVKKLFKAGKLTTSYEIWCPEKKRKYLPDGTYELTEGEIAGGALLFKEKPAFEDAKVLEIAKQKSSSVVDGLVFASLDESEIICSNGKCELVKSDVTNTLNKIKCSNCGYEFESGELENIKCPKCFAILNKNGEMIYPPQIIDFNLLCPSCKLNNWIILSKEKDAAKIKCSGCAKEYKITFATKKKNEFVDNLHFLYSSTINCPQCGNVIEVITTSQLEEKELICSRCGLHFSAKLGDNSYRKKIIKIEELNEENEKKEGKEMKIELSKFHRYLVDGDFETFLSNLPSDYIKDFEEAKKINYEERKNLPDKDFAVVIRIKNKKTGKTRKIRMFIINDEAHVRNALARLAQTKVKETLKKLGVSIKEVEKKILKRAKELKMEDLLKRHEPVKASREEVLINGIKKLVKMLIEARKEQSLNKASVEETNELKEKLDKTEKELELAKEKTEFYKKNAKVILERRQELGDYAKDLSDEDLLDKKNYQLAKVTKERDELLSAKKNDDKDDIVGTNDDKTVDKVKDEIEKKTKEFLKLEEE